MTKQAFYYAKDVARILSVSERTSYGIIKKLNQELESKGYFTIAGRISQKYFEERFYVGEGQI